MPLEITVEQSFQLTRMRLDLSKSGFEDEAQNLILEMARQLMVKDNVIKHLVGKCAQSGCL